MTPLSQQCADGRRFALQFVKCVARHRAAILICNHCPKCGDTLVAMTFREVPLDHCPGCKGIWLGTKDLAILAQKDHRTWFDKWFKGAAD